MRVHWAPGVTEPLLWAPDIVLGALGDAHATGGKLPREILEIVTEIPIDL